VNANDRVLVSINPSSAVEYYYSYVYFPNQTIVSQLSEYGSHSYNFVAAVSGNYVLSFKTGSSFGAGAGFNYSIDSSHVISDLNTRQATPFSVKGLAQPVQTIQQDIYGVKANDLVLLSLSPSSAVEYYYSYVYFPNQTIVSQLSEYGSHSYNFVAAVSGNYVLSFKTGSSFGAGAGFNFTIKSSHSLTQQGPTSSPTPTITTPPPTPIPPITINAVQGDEVTFTIQSAGSYGPKTIDFGDGNISTTSEQSISHNYEKAGNYTVMITIPQTTGEKIVQTYLVTVSPKAPPTDIFTQLTDIRVIIAIISTIIGALSFYLAYKNYKGKQTRNENKPIPPPPPIEEKETKLTRSSKHGNLRDKKQPIFCSFIYFFFDWDKHWLIKTHKLQYS
jgi:PKD repeat protein